MNNSVRAGWEIFSSVLQRYPDWKDAEEILTALLGISPKYKPPTAVRKSRVSVKKPVSDLPANVFEKPRIN